MLAATAETRPPRLATRLAAVLPAAAFVAGGWALARFQPAEAAAETAFLSLLAGCVLAGAALVAPAARPLALVAPAIVATALWALPAGPARGAVLGVALVATAAAASWACWSAPVRARRPDGLAWTGGALAVHALLRPADLLPATLSPWLHGAAPLARLLLPPLAAALALALLARRHGAERAVVAGAVVALTAAGFTVTASLPLLALAVASEVAHLLGRSGPRRTDESSWRGLLARLGPARAAGTRAEIAALGLAALAAVAFALLRPAAGGLALGAGAVVLMRSGRGVAAAALLVAVASVLAVTRSPSAAFAPVAQLWQLVVLLPLAWLPGRGAARAVLAALLLAAGGLLLLPAPPALAAAAALLALELRRDDAAAALERSWLAVLLALAALAAAYPWLRSEPLLAATGLLGIGAGWSGAAAVLGVALVAVAAAHLLERRRSGSRHLPSGRRAALFVAAAAIVAALAVAIPPPSRDLLRGQPAALAAGTTWSRPWSGSARWLRIESLLSNAATLREGAPVAVVLLEREGRIVDRLELRAGEGTGEWAADRPDLRGRVAAAPAALSWVRPEGGGFFGRAYRVLWRRPEGPVQRIVVERAPGLPVDSILVLRRVEVAR